MSHESAFHGQRQESFHARGSTEALAHDDALHLLTHLSFGDGFSYFGAANAFHGHHRRVPTGLLRGRPMPLARHEDEAKRPTDHTQRSSSKKCRVHGGGGEEVCGGSERINVDAAGKMSPRRYCEAVSFTGIRRPYETGHPGRRNDDGTGVS